MDDGFVACDQCGPNVRAYVYVTLINGAELTYCGSHGKQHRNALEAAGATVDDFTDYVGYV
ncbi:DUF7455 domain-containing protein [Microbacterium sp. NPDC055455]